MRPGLAHIFDSNLPKSNFKVNNNTLINSRILNFVSSILLSSKFSSTNSSIIELIFELFILSEALFKSFLVSDVIFSDKNIDAALEKSDRSTEEKVEKSTIGKFNSSVVRKSEE